MSSPQRVLAWGQALALLIALMATSTKAASAQRAARPQSGKPLVATYYFYWYDDASKAHFVNPDGSDALTDHPVRSEGYSYLRPEWHRGELLEMAKANIDVALPVYWGYPGGEEEWSFDGLPPMVAAARSLLRDKLPCPRIGLFYDTSTLQFNAKGYHADLTTPEGKAWFYDSVKLFFQAIPRDLWATVDGRPIVWLYSAAFAKKQDPTALDYLRRSFRRDFRLEPYIVKEVSWQGRADATYAWGAALNPTIFSVAAVGPGYDHSAVPGREPLKKDREGGDFYRRSWEWVLARPTETRPRIAVIETWNEWHEGTDIAPSREYGRLYVDLTRKYARMWKQGVRLPPSGKYAQVNRVRGVLTRRNRDEGVRQVERPDGLTEAVEVQGVGARRTAPNPHGPARYMYFDVDNAFYFGDGVPVTVEVTYLDESEDEFGVEYDSTDFNAPYSGCFKPSKPVRRTGSGEWRKARFFLPDAALTGRANGADFRLSVSGADLTIRDVTVTRVPPAKPKPGASRAGSSGAGRQRSGGGSGSRGR